MKQRTLVAVAVSLLGGCSLVPNYQTPELPVAEQVGTAVDGGDQATLPTLPGWRTMFPDSQLQELIASALSNNRDLRMAMLNVAEARAQYGIEGAALYPELAVGADGSRQRLPADLSGSGDSRVASQYGVQLGLMSYELDLFGRVRSLESAALQQYLATEEARRSAQLTLVSEVTTAYLTLMADAEKLRISEQAEADQQRAINLIRRRYESGLSTELDLRQAEIALETARASRAQYARLVSKDRNALAVLVGGDTPVLAMRELTDPAVTPLTGVPAGLPATVLTARPDIRQAEHRLRSANANIGAARAAFFPRIALTGSVGTASGELSGLFDAGSGAWSFAPSLSLPIFTGGRNQANLDLAEIRRDQRVVDYEQTVQQAFREVADTLSARQFLAQQEQAQSALVAATARSLTLAEARFEEGVDDYLAVLDARRALLDARQQLVSVTLQKLTNRVQLYRSLGGGGQADRPTLVGDAYAQVGGATSLKGEGSSPKAEGSSPKAEGSSLRGDASAVAEDAAEAPSG